MTDQADHDDEVVLFPCQGLRTPSSVLGEINRIESLYRSLLREIGRRDCLVNINPRWAAISRTHIEQGAMALRRAVFHPNEEI